MKITKAEKKFAPEIARLIMQAMNYDCCRNFTGEGHTLDEFESIMTKLVEEDNSQYSYRNTLVALDDNGKVAGICVGYDGARLHELREAFLKVTREAFGVDHSKMDDETAPGEFYVDSLAVRPDCQHRGIATALLKEVLHKASEKGFRRVGLLVDKGNPKAERLYASLGFIYRNDTTWGGHPMKHLQYITNFDF